MSSGERDSLNLGFPYQICFVSVCCNSSAMGAQSLGRIWWEFHTRGEKPCIFQIWCKYNVWDPKTWEQKVHEIILWIPETEWTTPNYSCNVSVKEGRVIYLVGGWKSETPHTPWINSFLGSFEHMEWGFVIIWASAVVQWFIFSLTWIKKYRKLMHLYQRLKGVCHFIHNFEN